MLPGFTFKRPFFRCFLNTLHQDLPPDLTQRPAPPSKKCKQQGKIDWNETFLWPNSKLHTCMKPKKGVFTPPQNNSPISGLHVTVIFSSDKILYFSAQLQNKIEILSENCGETTCKIPDLLCEVKSSCKDFHGFSFKQKKIKFHLKPQSENPTGKPTHWNSISISRTFQIFSANTHNAKEK